MDAQLSKSIRAWILEGSAGKMAEFTNRIRERWGVGSEFLGLLDLYKKHAESLARDNQRLRDHLEFIRQLGTARFQGEDYPNADALGEQVTAHLSGIANRAASAIAGSDIPTRDSAHKEGI